MTSPPPGSRPVSRLDAFVYRLVGALGRPRWLVSKIAVVWRRWRHGPAYARALSRGDLLAGIPGATPAQGLISVAVPVFRVAEEHLRAAIASVRRQTHRDWELLLLDDASPEGHVPRVLREAASEEERIRTWRRSANAGIAVASNEILQRARGELVVFLDHDDVLHPRSLEHVSSFSAQHPEVDWIFSDEDKVSVRGKHYQPCIKPGWSHHHLLAFNLVTHLRAVRRELLLALGGHRPGLDGAQDYDLALRAVAAEARFAHLQGILYHWRAVPSSMARAAASKPTANQASLAALARHAASWPRGGAVTTEVVYAPASLFRVRRRPGEDLSIALLGPANHTRPQATMGRRRLATVPLSVDGLDPGALIATLARLREDVVVVAPPGGLDVAQLDELLSLLQVPKTALVGGRHVHGRRVVASGWVAAEDGSLCDPWAGLHTSSSGYLNLAWVPGPRLLPEPWGWAAWREELLHAWEAALDVPPAWRLAIGCSRLGLEVITTPAVSFPAIEGAPPPPPLPIPAPVPVRWSRWLEPFELARTSRRATIPMEVP